MSDQLESTEEVSVQEWQYQLRVQLEDSAAAAARGNVDTPALTALYRVLKAHNAEMVCQYDAFAGYCEQAERLGQDELPLYKWTKATIENPEKQAKYVKIFTLYVGGEEVYSKESADALELDLEPMVGGPVVEKLSKYDSNPKSNPQVPKKYRT